jgi:NAD(P)-dependent dehydrogenase (short-subunit alcohol dehydrogenase family)
MSDLSDKTTIVVGASRGLGRGIAAALAGAGAPVVAVARTAAGLADLAGVHEIADPPDPSVAGRLLDRYEPRAVVLVAGATPFPRPLGRTLCRRLFDLGWLMRQGQARAVRATPSGEQAFAQTLGLRLAN